MPLETTAIVEGIKRIPLFIHHSSLNFSFLFCSRYGEGSSITRFLVFMKTASLGLLEVRVVRVNAGGDAPPDPPSVGDDTGPFPLSFDVTGPLPLSLFS